MLPNLGSVPSPYGSADPDLVIKATATGITLLTERRYRKRYIGSKKAAVDINGKLFLDARKLDREIKASKEGQKKRRVPSRQCLIKEKDQISDELAEKQTSIEDSSKKTWEKSYSVNKREVRQRLLAFINTQKGKKELYFWTVTFPAGTSDAIAYQAYNTWLTSLRKYDMLHDYLWVAERQDGKRNADGQATNTIHFHIAIPHKMPVKRANAMMAGTLKNFARQGLIPFSVAQCSRYNGVDISKHRTTKRVTNFAIKKGARALATYLSKYVTKNDASFTHLAWHNSRGFSALFTAITFTITEFKALKFGPFLNRIRVFEMQFAKFIPWLFGPPPLLTDHLYKLNSHIQSLIDA